MTDGLKTKFVNRVLSSAVRGDEEYQKAARYLIESGGQRKRAVTGLAAYTMLGGTYGKFVDSAAGIELAHAASLIIDDLPCFDNAATRRGKPAVHITYGQDTAILAAFRLLSLGRTMIYDNALDHLVDADEKARDPKYLRGVNSLLDETIEGMIKGEGLDIRKVKGEEELWECVFLKNRLYHLACVLPAYLLGRDDKVKTLDELGRDLSVVAQLADDLYDATADPLTADKPVRVDRDTFVTRFGPQWVRSKIEERRERIVDNIGKIKQGKFMFQRLVDKLLKAA